MEEEVRHATTAADTDPAVRLIVLTGAGRGFCSGMDMEVLDTISTERQLAAPAGRTENGGNLAGRYSWFLNLSKPVVAAINGPCVGLGLVMASYCDIRIAAASAVFSTTFSRRGLVAEHGLSWVLPKIVGHSNALELLLSARKFDASEALRLGLVSQVIDSGGFAEAVTAYVADLAENVSPRSLRIIKRQAWNALFQDLTTAIRDADKAMHESFRSADFREGVSHFIERRKPHFTGL